MHFSRLEATTLELASGSLVHDLKAQRSPTYCRVYLYLGVRVSGLEVYRVQGLGV